MLQVRENEISLRSCVIHNDVSEAGSDPASKFRGGGDFSDILQSSLITGSLL